MAVVSLTGLKHLAQVFPRNRRSLNSPIGGMARKAMHLARKETPRRRAGRKIDRRAAAWDRGRKMEIDRNQQPGTGADSADLIPDEISPPGRLKCLNSLYRPALPEGTAGRLSSRRFFGRREPPDGQGRICWVELKASCDSAAAAKALLGRRQVVRQWILIPPYGGSNPPAPARQSGPQGSRPWYSEKCPPIAGFSNSANGLQP